MMKSAQRFSDEQIVSAESTQLQNVYGQTGFTEKNVRRMVQIASQSPNEQKNFAFKLLYL